MNQIVASNDPNDIRNKITLFEFSIYGVTGFRSVVANGASPRKRMMAAVNYIDREFSQMLKDLGTDRRCWGPTAHDNAHCYERIGKLMVNLKDVMKRLTDEAILPVKIEKHISTMTTEQFLEEGGDTYKGNVQHFRSMLAEIIQGEKKYFDERRAAGVGKKQSEELFVNYVPHLYECTGGIFGKDKFHLILSLETIKSLSHNGSVVEAVQRLCREHLNSVKSFRLTDYIRDTENREKIKDAILETDRMIGLLPEIHVYHLSRLFANRTPAVLRAQGKSDEVMPKVSRVMQTESRELLQIYVMDKASPHKAPVDPDEPQPY